MNYDKFYKKYYDLFKNAFNTAIKRIKDNAQIADLKRAYDAGNIDEVIELLQVDEGAFFEFKRVYEDSFIDVFQSKYQGQIRALANFRFNVRDPQAEEWIRNKSGNLIGEITQEQRENIRIVLRESLAKGDNPTKAVSQIVGRYNVATKRREGGIIGLNSQMLKYKSNAREDLEKGKYGEYLQRERRDRRYDGLVMKAARDERELTASEVERITNAYENRLLALRAETIGRTETIQSLNAAEYFRHYQLIQSGKVEQRFLTKVWKATYDSRTRHSHAYLHNKEVGFYEPFRTNGGDLLMYPTDSSLGAGADEIINCRCRVFYKVDFIAQAKAEEQGNFNNRLTVG